MLDDIGGLEILTIAVIAILIFGPDKLPKLIQDTAAIIRKIRSFSDSAKQDIRSELGPEFKDFEFEDLNPKNFIRKQLAENGGGELKELRESFDLRKELTEVTDAVKGREPRPDPAADVSPEVPAPAAGPDLTKRPAAPAEAEHDMFKKPATPAAEPRVRYDLDAT
ncbi:sec-independent translocase [Streptomyces sp. BI20]|uniref:sec-independent translocase n=1 Tax=Streptomyces sp. BI20 TaxID=3403460 RepID=UPI003C78C250